MCITVQLAVYRLTWVLLVLEDIIRFEIKQCRLIISQPLNARRYTCMLKLCVKCSISSVKERYHYRPTNLWWKYLRVHQEEWKSYLSILEKFHCHQYLESEFTERAQNIWLKDIKSMSRMLTDTTKTSSWLK